MKQSVLRTYESPDVEILSLSCEDVLTWSNGFDGEDHTLAAE